MQIPMETLSQLIPRADSGAGGPNSMPAAVKSDSKFSKVFDESRAVMQRQKLKGPQLTDDAQADKDAIPIPPKKERSGAEDDEGLAAGVMGYQNVIVFILEGDKDSATTPDISVEGVGMATAAIAPEPDATQADAGLIAEGAAAGTTGEFALEDGSADPDEGGYVEAAEVSTDIAAPDPKADPDSEVAPGATTGPDAASAPEVTAGPGAELLPDPKAGLDSEAGTDAKAVSDAPARAAGKAGPDAPDESTGTVAITVEDVKAAAGAIEVFTGDAGDTEIEAEAAAGEVTARTPETGTSDERKNDDSAPISDNGDLSPLENENDTISVKGQKEKSNSETDDAAKNDSGKRQDMGNNVPVVITESIRPERFQADQQMKQSVGAPVRTENLFEEMVSHIESMQTESRQSVAIQLKPEFLGKVALEIAMDAAGLHVKISAANNDVRNTINGQINALVESLEHKGIEVVEVEVAYTGVDNGAFKDQSRNQAQPDRPRRSYNANRIEDTASYFSAIPIETLEYYLDAGVSSVEYRA